MSTDDQKVGLIPVTLMVAGNIMGSGVFLLPANLASTGGIAIWGWLVTIIGALALSMVYAKMSSLDDSPGGVLCLCAACLWAIFRLSNECLVLVGMLDR
ncbi:Arginine/agmatine antiporter [Yersinia pseudotuberculosis]|nr:Arginine/agmatine antiporter [Yersinia pseudotuberculosis]